MFAEAAEAPGVVRQQLTSNAELIRNLGEKLRARTPTGVVTFARGSSDHAATFAKYLIETSRPDPHHFGGTFGHVGLRHRAAIS